LSARTVLTEGLAERPALRPSSLIQISLGRAVVDLETGRVAVAGRRVAMADQRDVTATDERGPGFLGIAGSGYRRGERPKWQEQRARTATSTLRMRSGRPPSVSIEEHEPRHGAGMLDIEDRVGVPNLCPLVSWRAGVHEPDPTAPLAQWLVAVPEADDVDLVLLEGTQAPARRAAARSIAMDHADSHATYRHDLAPAEALNKAGWIVVAGDRFEWSQSLEEAGNPRVREVTEM
jgi:hypothetical protein